MIEIKFGKKFAPPVILALGMFDCVHSAHIKLIEKVKSMSEKKNALSAVFTFTNNSPSANKAGKLLYTYSERLKRFNEEGVEAVVYKSAGGRFSKLSALDFLDTLKRSLNLKGLVCGEDFRFGKGASGDINLLSLYCKKNGINLEIVKTIYVKNVKVSTSNIKELLSKGAVEEANHLLVKPYRMTGKVVSGAGLGKSMIFPTANIIPDETKALVKDGVYYTKVGINGEKYKAVTNFGGRPTLNKEEIVCETHILDFSGNLYKKEITVEFLKRIRDIQSFKNIEELKSQIEKDIEVVRKIK